MRMEAYYYTFGKTGDPEIDLILSAVACAGKAYHHTQCWNDESSPYEGHTGETPVEWIQNAANAAAKSRASVSELVAQNQGLVEERGRLREALLECHPLLDKLAKNTGWRWLGENGQEVFYCEFCEAHDADCSKIPHLPDCETLQIEFIQTCIRAALTPAAPAEQPTSGAPKVYAASRASLPERPAMWRTLRDDGGVCITSSWIDEAGPGESASLSELWQRIVREIASSDVLVLYVESEDFPLKGALIEVGIALGMGKPVRIVCPGVTLEERSFRPLGSWTQHPSVTFHPTVIDAVAPHTVEKPEGE